MACTSNDVACEIDELTVEVARLVEAQGNDLFGNFVTTLVATLVGAAVAFLSAMLLARRESQERQDTVLVDHVERLGTAITAWAPEHASHLMRLHLNAPTERDPDRTAVDVALDMLIARTKGKDREVALRVRQVVYEQNFIEDDDWAVPEIAAVRRTIVAWAARLFSQDEALVALDTFRERAATKTASPSVPWEQIEPAVPDPYPMA